MGPAASDFGFRLPFGRPPPLFNPDGEEIKYTMNAACPAGHEPGAETGVNVNDSCFGIGGSDRDTWVRDSLCAFHISIGEAF